MELERTGKCPYCVGSGASTGFKDSKKKEIVYPGDTDNYIDYLKLPQLLDAQHRLTDDPLAHDEHLFIIVHQNFELWFKQILYELKSVKKLLKQERVCERSQQLVLQRIVRINCILRIMVQQFEVLETMNCVGFASFRSVFKGGASGFQSTQFRILEQTLGIKEQHRTCTFLNAYNDKLTEEQRAEIEAQNDEDDVFTLINKWLSRTPGLRFFITTYKNAVEGEVNQLLTEAKLAAQIDPPRSEKLMEEAKDTEQKFSVIFDSQKYQQASNIQGINLSYESFMGALMITCYASEPRFAVPYEIIKNLIDMDVFFTKWRFTHAMMVKRMIGGRPGTGGSGGYTYLRSTVSDRYMPFKDLFEVATYMIPPQKLPALTPIMLEEISQVYVSRSQRAPPLPPDQS